jgi:putative spermidine/putrescine transport system permease protein
VLTVWVSLCSTVLSTVLGLGAALLLHSLLSRGGRRPGWAAFLFQLNLPVPHAVGAIAVLLLFSQSGLLARLAYTAGWIDSPSGFPALVFDRYGIGIILEYLWKTTVFTAVILLAALESAGEEHQAAARTLGAGPWQRFRYVTLPLLLPALASASILVFAFTFGGYEVPYLLGQRTASLLPVLAYREYSRVDLNARPQAMAISLLIAAITTALVWLYMRRMEP